MFARHVAYRTIEDIWDMVVGNLFVIVFQQTLWKLRGLAIKLSEGDTQEHMQALFDSMPGRLETLIVAH